MYYKISCSIQTGVDTPLNPKKSDGNKKRMTEGYRPEFLIYIDGVPFEIIETERRLAATAATAATTTDIYHNRNSNSENNTNNIKR